LPLFVVEFSIAIFIELFLHPFAHLFASRLTLLVAQLTVAIFVVFFEHSLAHFLTAGPVTALAALLGRLGENGQAHKSGPDHYHCCHNVPHVCSAYGLRFKSSLVYTAFQGAPPGRKAVRPPLCLSVERALQL
jgi:hypothetical protein